MWLDEMKRANFFFVAANDCSLKNLINVWTSASHHWINSVGLQNDTKYLLSYLPA